MKHILRCIFIINAFLVTRCIAQESWPSPELAQMYAHANEYTAMGNLKDAIITYRQAIKLAPEKMLLYKGLGNALYLSRKYDEAEEVLAPAAKGTDADTTCYRLLAACQEAQNDSKHAKATLHKGLDRFPEAGALYHELGAVLQNEEKTDAALDAWTTGITKEPGYAPNYYEAANGYLESDDVIMGLVYGETFLDIVHDTLNDEQLKGRLFAGYKTMFDNIGSAGTAKHKTERGAIVEFEGTVRKVYTSLTPVVSDGITTENLTMVRTRFLMEWFTSFNKKYPSALFAYQDELLRNGLFDIYNEWLFGKAESGTEYGAWIKFHPVELGILKEWMESNRLLPVVKEMN